MREAIRAVPDGEYEALIRFHEQDTPMQVRCRVGVRGEDLVVDFTGTSPQQPKGGINCTWVYTRGQTSYCLKCILLPAVPSNAGVYRPIRLTAPEGCILNARHPASVRMRTRIGWYIHHALFSALAGVVPDQVLAPHGFMDGGTIYALARERGKAYHSWYFSGGGMGAGAETDGNSSCIYPSSASNVPIEMLEVAVPMVVVEKELVTDTGGAGRRRGGLGQRTSVRRLEGFDGTVTVSPGAHGQNVRQFGLGGGLAGQAAEVSLDTRVLTVAERVAMAGALVLDSPALVVGIQTAGGGGFGPPDAREPERVLEDVQDGLVSIEQAAETYGVVISPVSLTIDQLATARARQAIRDTRRAAASMPMVGP